MRSGLLAALVLVAAATSACGSRVEQYCDEVAQQQRPLSEAVSEGGPGALLEALPSLRALRDEAPEDLRDEWDIVVGRLEDLDAALEAAGVDPADYDRTAPPEGLDDEQRAAIEDAAARLATPEMVRSLAGVQQQARDVCQTPLTL